MIKIRGIHLRFHYSLVFLLAYVVLVAGIQFPWVAQQAGIQLEALPGNTWLWSMAFAVGLLVSVALHEFGHAFLAQAMGVKVRSITLMMLGGSSDLDRLPDKPYAELKLALIGPLVSLVIAVGLRWMSAATDSPTLALYGYWLGGANLVLAIFNLLPAFPLDGGRALRSALAARYGQRKGTELAVRVSRGLAWGLGILGFLTFNFLLIAIAFFIYTTAQSELYVQVGQDLLRDVPVRDVMLPVEAIPLAQTLDEAAVQMIQLGTTALPVGNEGDVLLLEEMQRTDRGLWSRVPVSSVVARAPRVLSAEENADAALPEIATARGQVLPVREGERVVGLLRLSDLSDALKILALSRNRIWVARPDHFK